MDKLAELNHGAKVVLGSAILLLIFSFFNWFEVDLGAPANQASACGHGVGVVAGLLLIALIVWQAVRLANINLEIGVGPAMVTAFLAILTLLFVFIRWIDNPYGDTGDRTIWAWLGLILGDRAGRRRMGEHEARGRERVRPTEAGTADRRTQLRHLDDHRPPPPPSATTPRAPSTVLQLGLSRRRRGPPLPHE